MFNLNASYKRYNPVLLYHYDKKEEYDDDDGNNHLSDENQDIDVDE